MTVANQPAPRTRRIWRALTLLIVAALLLRIALLPLYAYLPNGNLDESAWKFWMQTIHDNGFINILRLDDNNYLGYHWILWFLVAVYDVIGGPYTPTTPSLHILVKMPPLAFDVALILLIYWATATLIRDDEPAGTSTFPLTPHQQRLAFAAAAIIAFHPSVIYDSAIWAQVDAGTTAAEIIAIVCIVRGRYSVGWMAWTLGFMLKPHPIIIAPILALVTLRGGGLKGALQAAGSMALVAALVLGPWMLHGDTGRIIRIYRWLFHENLGRLSLAAWNFWWFPDLAFNLQPDQRVIGGIPLVTYRNVGLGFSLASLALAAGYVWSRPGLRGTLIACAYLAVSFYMLPISTHERYIYPFVAMLLPIAVTDRRWFWLYVPVSVTFFVNLFFAAPPVQAWSGRWVEAPFTLVVAGVNGLLFLAFTFVLARGCRPAVEDLGLLLRERRLPSLRRAQEALPPA